MLRAPFPAVCAIAGAFLLSGCSLSTPSPSGGHRLDNSPRVPGPGRMNTSLLVGVDRDLGATEQEAVRLGQAIVLPGGLQVGGVLEYATLSISQATQSPDTPDIEADGYYAGVYLKGTIVRKRMLSLSGHGGLGIGAFGEYVGYADAFGGVSVGLYNRILMPYFSPTAGMGLPYRRKAFDVSTSDVFFDEPGTETERHRFASASWVAWEFGLESPFGDPERGLRAFLATGQRYFFLLEKDRIGRYANHPPIVAEITTRFGLSWTY